MAILKKIITVLLLPVCLIGCYEDFIPETDVKPVLCLNSLITAGEPIEVKVSHTWLFTENMQPDTSVDDATVVIMVDGEEMGSDYLPKEGDHIKISADSRRYGHAEAEVTVPYTVPIEIVNWLPTVTSAWSEEKPDRKMICDISFNLKAEIMVEDPRETENYYWFTSNSFYSDHDSDGDHGYGVWYDPWRSYADVYFNMGILKYEAEPIFSEHIGVFESISGSDPYGFSFFTDRQFSGKSYPLHIQFADGRYKVESSDWNAELLECGYEFVLYSVSESYYNWANYVWQRDEGPRGDLSEVGFGEPLWGYSNVSTGAGVVAAQSSSTCRLNLKDFIETNFKITE